MKILIASSEAVPFVKTGGLADVAGSLYKEFRLLGHEAFLVLPLYRKINRNFKLVDTGIKIKVPAGNRTIEGRIYSYNDNCFFVECSELFDRDELYGTPEGDYTDNALRFIFFSRAIPELCRLTGLKPDIMHCNDWQTGLVPFYLKTVYKNDAFFKNTATVLTIHNLGYQGLFPASEMLLTGLGSEYFTPDGIEFYGGVNFLKAGLISADLINTVSNTYAQEILTADSGFGLDGVLRARSKDIFGIVNGIDYEEWNPTRDAYLPANFSFRDIRGKAVCKKELAGKLFRNGSEDSDKSPLIGIVGRLSGQKGLELVIKAAPEILSSGAKLVILGKGDDYIHKGLQEMSEKFPERVSLTLGFSDQLAHIIYAGSDFFLMPSRYEPCGLGQMIAMRYGTIPVARATGGLADTIEDYDPLASSGTGFLFYDYSSHALMSAIRTAFCVYTDARKMKNLVSGVMKKDFSWKNSAGRYIKIYNTALESRKAHAGIRKT